jgi:hypothetical protein
MSAGGLLAQCDIFLQSIYSVPFSCLTPNDPQVVRLSDGGGIMLNWNEIQ